MALYLVVHTPRPEQEEANHPPTRLEDLARDHGSTDADPRWIRTWSPDLHDGRIFSTWEAANAEEIMKVVEAYGFLNHMDAKPLRVQEWGPEDVLSATSD